MRRFEDLPKAEQERILRLNDAKGRVFALYRRGATALTFDEVAEKTGLSREVTQEILDHLVTPSRHSHVGRAPYLLTPLFLRDGFYRPTIPFQNLIQRMNAAVPS